MNLETGKWEISLGEEIYLFKNMLFKTKSWVFTITANSMVEEEGLNCILEL